MSQKQRYRIPQSFGDQYTAADIESATRVLTILNSQECKVDKATLARLASISETSVNRALGGTWPGSPTVQLRKMLAALGNDRPASNGYVETSLFKLLAASCTRAQHYRMFAVFSAFVGTGKTTAVRAYAREHEHVILIDGIPSMTATVLMRRIVDMSGADAHKTSRSKVGTLDVQLDSVIRRLRGTSSLIILDEAETVSAATLEYLRRICDLASIGVVLTGTETLTPMVRDPRGRFGQISSRVSFWPEPVRHITEADCKLLTEHYLPGIELSAELHQAFWQMCAGSARVLCNSLIPGLKDYGIDRGLELTPKLIERIGQDVLGFTRWKFDGGAK